MHGSPSNALPTCCHQPEQNTPEPDPQQPSLATSIHDTHTHSPHGPVEAEAAEAVAALGLQRPPQDLLTRIAQMLVFEVVRQDLLGEAGFVAFQ